MHFGGDYKCVPAGDLLLCKDVLQHLNLEEIFRFINVFLPRFKYALITNDVPKRSIVGKMLDKLRNVDLGVVQGLNKDIAIGDYRPIDLRLEPFKIPCDRVLEWRVNPYNVYKLLIRPRRTLMGDTCEWKKRTVMIVSRPSA